MAFVLSNGPVGSQPIASNSATQKHALGTIVTADDSTYGSGEFIYLKGVASTVVGSVVTYASDDFSTIRTVANIIGPVAVAMSACVASEYGWYQIQGKAVVKAGTVSDNALVYVTATDGVLDDAVVAGDRIKNATFASADGTPSAGLAECEIARPFCDDASAA